MSKFDPLWHYVQDQPGERLILSFDQIAQICGLPIDHSFLNAKRELLAAGWRVGKISLKGQTVTFEKQN